MGLSSWVPLPFLLTFQFRGTCLDSGYALALACLIQNVHEGHMSGTGLQVCPFSISEYSDHYSRGGGSVCMSSYLPYVFHE